MQARLRDQLRARVHPQPRVLVVTAVEAERAAVLRGLDLPDLGPGDPRAAIDRGDRTVVAAAGVGPAAAAATAAWLLAVPVARDPFDVVVSAGVAGGFVGRAPVGSVVLAARSIAADLGADTPDGFVSLTDLHLGQSTLETEKSYLDRLRSALPEAVVGDVLTVTTVTGTRKHGEALLARWPEAVAEAMEGFGVGCAAKLAGAAFLELRSVSNPVGPRDRAAWRLDEALASLERSVTALASLEP
jgi:futalosine hydrolase